MCLPPSPPTLVPEISSLTHQGAHRTLSAVLVDQQAQDVAVYLSSTGLQAPTVEPRFVKMWVLGIKLKAHACVANTLPPEPSLWPKIKHSESILC